jgi:hypothetical protein
MNIAITKPKLGKDSKAFLAKSLTQKPMRERGV